MGVLVVVNGLIIVAELPFTLTYLHEGLVLNQNICPAWILINYSLFILSIILTTWTSIERYFFIFHEQFMKRHRFILHYIPIGCFSVYTPIFYMILVIFYPCQQAFTLNNYLCGGPCYLFQLIPCMVDWSFNVAFMLLVTCVMNMLLIVLNIRQKYRMKTSIITAGKSQQWVN